MAAFRPGLSIALLGPLAVMRDDEELRLKGKERALAALLALDANRTVSVDRLIDGLWGDDPPASAQNMLHVYVSRLRRLFEPELQDGSHSAVLLRHGTGYELRLAHDGVDAERFERLAAEARSAPEPAEALARLEEALALWRGDALGDLVHEPFARHEAARLDELRLAVVEDRLDAALALGRDSTLVAELERLVASHPLRERLRAQLMLALYRSGRQADALAAFQDARRVLAQELGLEPGGALRRLERAILQQDTALDVDVPVAGPPPAPPAEARKVVTAIFVEFAPPPLDPEALHALLAEAAAATASVLERHGGAAERHGELVIGAFGVPTLHEDDAARALRAAEELRGVLAVPARIALVTRETVVGAGPLAESLLGLHPRMPEPGELAVDAATQRLAAARPSRDVALVGRDDELLELRSAFERMLRNRTAYLFTLLGQPGIGKSRLVDEFAAQLDGARVLRARCLPYGEAALAPIAGVVAQAAVEEGADAVAVVLESGRPLEETFLAVRRFLSALARRIPVVVVLDDLHWAEPTLLDLVDHVADLTRDAPLLLLCIARPELLDRRPAWGGGKTNARSLLLEPLSDADSERFVDELLDTPLPESTRARIREAAEGNPLFIEQLLASLNEGEVTIPPTLQALLAARVDRLEGAERTVLQAAAIVGKTFTASAVAELVPDAAAEIEHALDGLVRKELVRPAADAYRFRHVLIRDATYGLIPKTSRAQLHERCAARDEPEELTAYHLEQAHAYAAELGRPNAPGLAARAGATLAVAARRAYARGEDPSAAALWTRALALLPADAPERLEALIGLSEASRYAADYERAETASAEAVEVARGLADPSADWRARIARLHVLRRIDPKRLGGALAEVEAAIEALDERTDHQLLAHTYDALAEIAFTRSRAADVEAAALRAIEFARRVGDVRTRARSEAFLLGASLFGPLPVDVAVRRCEEIIAAPSTPRLVATALRALSGLRAMEGRIGDARELRGRSEAAYLELGLHAAVASSCEVFAHAELLAGDPAAAESALLDAREVFLGIGDRGALSTIDSLLARAALMLGRDEDALVLSERSASAVADEDLATQVQWRCPKAIVLARRGAWAEAEALAREAVAVADRTDFSNLRGDARCVLAGVLETSAQVEEARAELGRALELYVAKGNLVSAAEVRARLSAPAPA